MPWSVETRRKSQGRITPPVASASAHIVRTARPRQHRRRARAAPPPRSRPASTHDAGAGRADIGKSGRARSINSTVSRGRRDTHARAVAVCPWTRRLHRCPRSERARRTVRQRSRHSPRQNAASPTRPWPTDDSHGNPMSRPRSSACRPRSSSVDASGRLPMSLNPRACSENTNADQFPSRWASASPSAPRSAASSNRPSHPSELPT